MSRAPHDPRPSYLRPGPIGLVMIGGTVGTAARAAIEETLPHSGGFPWATFAVNVSGALLLGLLVEILALHRGSAATARRLRLLLGTGLLGGYTTYSTFIIESLTIGSEEGIAQALLYDSGTLVVGFLAALTAMTAYRWWRLRRQGHADDTEGGGRG